TKLKIASALLAIATAIALSLGAAGLEASAAAPPDPAADQKTPVPPTATTPMTSGEPAAERLPAGPLPVPALISLDENGKLIVRIRMTMVYEPVTTFDARGQSAMAYRQAYGVQTITYASPKLKVFDTAAKPVDAKHVLKILKKGELL